MFKNYFKTAFRNLSRNKVYTTINIAGLSTGIAVCAMIFVIILFHTSFDNFHPQQDRIYRVLTEYHHNDTKDVFTAKATPFGLSNALKTSFPQISRIAAIFASNNVQLTAMNSGSEKPKAFKEGSGVFYTNSSFFHIFNFPMLAGSSESLNDPNTVLLTKEIAEKYFADWKTAMGKTIKINNTDVVKVTGILATIPYNTQFPLKVVVSYGTGYTKTLSESTDNNGTSASLSCYILLPPNMSASTLNSQLVAFSKKVKAPDIKDVQIIQPLADIHFDNKSGDYSGKTISHEMVNALWLIGVFILLIACVNFINLSTAQAVNRSKEIGVRKVLGGKKWQLKLQFIAETFLIVLASVAAAWMITSLSLPFINQLLGLSLAISSANSTELFLFMAVTTILVTLLAGFYPSIVLSGFNPVNALKSKRQANTKGGISLRRGLVVFQFIIAQSLIIGTLVMIKQMNFFTSQPVGFDKEAVVNIPLPIDSTNRTKLSYLKKQLLSINGIKSVSFSSNTPVEDNADFWIVFNFDHQVEKTKFFSIAKLADNDYLPTYKLPLVAGRNIVQSDTLKEFLVNEMLLRNLGITDPRKGLNKEIMFSETSKGLIVGVLKDFNTRSFRDGLAPVLITSMKTEYNQASVKLDSKNASSVIAALEKTWNSDFPEFVFEYRFLDDKLESFYKTEKQLSNLYRVFAAIAIFLSCLGLYGLASFMAIQRIKEVGIRKILGATVQHIIYLFSKEFVVLITISFLIATPIAWYYMHQWLQHFQFRIALSWWLFFAGGFCALLIALATVSFQAIKAAVANPVKNLRSE